MTQSPVAVDFGEAVAAAAVAAVDATTETTRTIEDSNEDDDDNNEDMSSEATHSRKSRLAVPAGGDDAVPGASLSSSPGGGGGVGGGSSGAGLPTTSTTTTASSSSAAGVGAGSASASSSSSSGLPLLSRKHRHGTAAAAGAAAAGGLSSSGLLSLSSSNLRPMHYFSRLTDVRQMDIQSALDQMKTLLSTRPQIVYKTSYYRKQTKNHWARDDPAFCALQALFLLVAAIAYSVAFRCTLTGAISFILYAVIWNWLGMGLVLATTCREIANRQLTAQQPISASHVRQQVEWLYAFDIHCNAFFPVFVVLYALQFFLLPVVLGQGLLPLILANTLYGAALSWYWYITHLGYRSLPFLSNTEVFLFPIAAIILLYAVMLFGYPFGFGWNAARVMARFYFI